MPTAADALQPRAGAMLAEPVEMPVEDKNEDESEDRSEDESEDEDEDESKAQDESEDFAVFALRPRPRAASSQGPGVCALLSLLALGTSGDRRR